MATLAGNAQRHGTEAGTRHDADAPGTAGQPTDAQLVAAARCDPLAFAPLYQRYVTPVYRYCYRQVSDPEPAADLTSRIFTRALEALPRFTPRELRETDAATSGGTFRGWLFAIAHNAIIDNRRRHRPSVPLDATYERCPDADQGPEDHAILRDELSRLIAVLDQIPDNQRQIIELRLAGLTAAEIAGTLGMTRAAVKSAQTRAYSRLRSLLDAENAADQANSTPDHLVHPESNDASR